MKKYIDAQLQVVQIKKSDIVTASPVFDIYDNGTLFGGQLSSGRRLDDWNSWYEGY